MGTTSYPVAATIAAYERGATLYARNTTDRSHMRHLHEQFAELLDQGASVLDLGCGPGHDGAALVRRGFSVTACDPTRGLLGEARKHASLHGRLVLGDARALPFEKDSFDSIWACASLLHVLRSQASHALSEAFRVLKPGGVLFTSMQEGADAGPVLTGPDDSLPGRSYFFYRAEEWKALVEAAGFELMEQRLKRTSAHVNEGATGWIETFARKPLPS